MFDLCLFRHLWIFAEPSVPAQTHDTEEGLAEDAAAHLACAFAAVDEDDGHLFNLKANLVGRKLHLYLEGIALEANLVERDGLEHATLVALKAGCGVVNAEACDKAHILGSEIAHEHAADGPVDNVDTAHIARARQHRGVAGRWDHG